jgi:uncharacterized protein YjbI with pentapeptide repeats
LYRENLATLFVSSARKVGNKKERRNKTPKLGLQQAPNTETSKPNLFNLNITYLNLTYLNLTYLSLTYLNLTYLNLTYLNLTYLNLTYLNLFYLSLT